MLLRLIFVKQSIIRNYFSTLKIHTIFITTDLISVHQSVCPLVQPPHCSAWQMAHGHERDEKAFPLLPLLLSWHIHHRLSQQEGLQILLLLWECLCILLDHPLSTITVMMKIITLDIAGCFSCWQLSPSCINRLCCTPGLGNYIIVVLPLKRWTLTWVQFFVESK